eukprot:227636-Amphidinium_carterae.1
MAWTYMRQDEEAYAKCLTAPRMLRLHIQNSPRFLGSAQNIARFASSLFGSLQEVRKALLPAPGGSF